MRFYAFLAVTWIFDFQWCGVFAADGPVTVQKIYVEKNVKNDLATEASGYIFRSDGDNPPILIKLGANNINQYEDVLKNAGVSLDAEQPQYTSHGGGGGGPRNTYSNVQATTTYSTHEDLFRGAFKNMPSPTDVEADLHDFPPLQSAAGQFAGPQGDGPGEEDGYENAGVESPRAQPHRHYASSGEYADGPPAAAPSFGRHKPPVVTGRAYVAPLFDVPDPARVDFNRRAAPVKYALQPKIPQAYFAARGRDESGEAPPAPVLPEVGGGGGGGDAGDGGGFDEGSAYRTRFAADYHHKPQKHKFEKGGGGWFEKERHSSHGEKGDKGHKTYHDFDEGEMGHHGKEGKKGGFDEESGHKKQHHHHGKKYGEAHGQHHGDKGAKYDETEAHNKGHKTSGYHNVFHKDEFKKEHKFYDDAHKHKHHDKHGGYHLDHDKKHGHKAAGAFHDSHFDQGHKADAGHYKKGHFDQDHKGHNGASGHESHYNRHNDYAKKGGHSENHKHGYEHSH